jgi:hypothetical protein
MIHQIVTVTCACGDQRPVLTTKNGLALSDGERGKAARPELVKDVTLVRPVREARSVDILHWQDKLLAGDHLSYN